jgi:hypothetical protein
VAAAPSAVPAGNATGLPAKKRMTAENRKQIPQLLTAEFFLFTFKT